MAKNRKLKKSTVCEKCKPNKNVMKCTVNIYGNHHSYGGRPAIKYKNGTKKWYSHNCLHREDGPACEYANGDNFWFLRGVAYSEREWKKKVNEMNKNRGLEGFLFLLFISVYLLMLWIMG